MIKQTSHLLGLIFLLVFFFEGYGQVEEKETVNQATEWFVLNSNIKLHKRFGFAFDGQLRDVGKFESAQDFVRLGLEFYVTPKLSIIPIGGMYVWNFKYGKQPVAYVNDEARIWHQITYIHSTSRFHFHHRFRMEERFLQNKGQDDETFSTQLYRARYRFLVNIALNKTKIEKGTWYASVWDEFFYGWGSGDTFNKIDQNRFSVGIGYQIAPKISVTAGALYQLLVKSNGAQQENNIGSIIQFNYNFDFTKKTD
ncbi:MAG TPA: DUF2490 domain-containing protein [Chryseolinea sp.]|nr:DUF2490 domain-containing protein [Chryseolinea sp.]